VFCADWASDGTGGNEAIYGQLQVDVVEGGVFSCSVGKNTGEWAQAGQLALETLNTHWLS